MIIKEILGLFSFKMWTCKIREEWIKNDIFICNMHGMDVVKYAKLNHNHTPILILLLVPSKTRKEKLYYKCYYTTFAGDAIALSMCNKPLNL